MKIYIYVEPYDENSGGNVVLHRLCHVINQQPGYIAYLVPKKSDSFKGRIKLFLSKFKTNTLWDAPVYKRRKIPDSAVIIYPETTDGNPMRAKNVVRWLLHQPGYFSKKINYSGKELYFKFNSAIHDFAFKNSKTSTNYLKVIYYPVEIYNEDSTIIKDIDVCYMVRKGHYKKIVHGDNAICLDGMSHQDIAKFFKRAKRFICYDDYTAYSIFAVLCGCESVVIPDGKTTIDEWYPCISDRYGIAYGLGCQQLEWARETKSKVKDHIMEEVRQVEISVKNCLSEIESYFQKE